MIDFHCHLDLYEDPTEVIDRADRAGIYVLSVTTTPKAWPATRRLASGCERIQTALGLHPQVAHERLSELSLFELMLPEAKYIGEIGLDGSREYRAHQAAQLEAFETILVLAERAGGRTMSLHSRNATTVVLDTLAMHTRAGTPVLHWFTGTTEELARASQMGCWFSVGVAMMNSKKGRERIRQMPRDRILTETDGPFVARGNKPLEPTDTFDAVAALAEIWNVSLQDTKAVIGENLRGLANIAGSLARS